LPSGNSPARGLTGIALVRQKGAEKGTSLSLGPVRALYRARL